MKILSLETCKRLQEKWLLDNSETELIYSKNYWHLMSRKEHPYWNNIKAHDLEEAIELLPDNIIRNWSRYFISIYKTSLWYTIYYSYYNDDFKINWKTLLEAVEKMINYLLDNNLL